ncbi:MAG: hypothetical protein N0A16_13330, partial [Blastocatellia bacterium]|nr:hypothetical protein [Blastocatellia bacterium]
GKAGQRMMAVVLNHLHRTGKTYRLPAERDLKAYCAAEAALEEKCRQLREAWGIEPVPDEEIQMTGRGQVTTPLFGMTRFGDLFNARQKLALVTFADAVRPRPCRNAPRWLRARLRQGSDDVFGANSRHDGGILQCSRSVGKHV